MGQPAETAVDLRRLGAGFPDLVLDGQAAFRELLSAMSRPGEIRRLEAGIEAPAGLEPAAAILCLALCDGDTPVWLPEALRLGPAGAYLRFHCGAPLAAAPGEAAFAVLSGAPGEPGLLDFDPGLDRYPDRSATVILQVEALERGPRMRLEGPGIDGFRTVAPAGLPTEFWADWAQNHAGYPLGVDVVLASGRSVLALPRSVAALQEG